MNAEPCGAQHLHSGHVWRNHDRGRDHHCPGVRVTQRHTPSPFDPVCGCGIPNRSAYWYVIPVHHVLSNDRAIVRIYKCVKHRVDPHDVEAVRAMFEFDDSGEWAIDSVECKPAARYVREEDLAAAFEGAPLAWGLSDTDGLITEAAAKPVEVDLHLRSRSEEEDNILRHYRGSLHNGAECRACKIEVAERALTEAATKREHEHRAELRRVRRYLNSIIEG